MVLTRLQLNTNTYYRYCTICFSVPFLAGLHRNYWTNFSKTLQEVMADKEPIFFKGKEASITLIKKVGHNCISVPKQCTAEYTLQKFSFKMQLLHACFSFNESPLQNNLNNLNFAVIIFFIIIQRLM